MRMLTAISCLLEECHPGTLIIEKIVAAGDIVLQPTTCLLACTAADLQQGLSSAQQPQQPQHCKAERVQCRCMLLMPQACPTASKPIHVKIGLQVQAAYWISPDSSISSTSWDTSCCSSGLERLKPPCSRACCASSYLMLPACYVVYKVSWLLFTADPITVAYSDKMAHCLVMKPLHV